MLLDMVRSMMILTTLPKSFWGHALESVTRILNMVPTKKVDRTLYEIWHGKALKLSYLRVWVNKIFVARNVEFFENSLTLLEVSGSDTGLELIQEDDTQPSKNTSERHDEFKPNEVEPHSVEVSIRRSGRISQAADRYGFHVDAEEHELGDLNEPPNYKVTLSDPKSNKWLDAMNTEMQSMKDNQVWCLVDLPPNGRIVGNYGEIFSHVVDMRAIRVLLAIADDYDYKILADGCQNCFFEWSPNKHLEAGTRDLMWKLKRLVSLKNPDEPCVYLKYSGSNVALLILYVDDILIMGNNVAMLQDVKSWLFKVLILIKILKKFKMKNSKRGRVPLQEKPDYRKSQVDFSTILGKFTGLLLKLC
ncbi:hypothetical protein Tco_0521094 [Tanacetum coccineum]